jgi:hypothetical protein
MAAPVGVVFVAAVSRLGGALVRPVQSSLLRPPRCQGWSRRVVTSRGGLGRSSALAGGILIVSGGAPAIGFGAFCSPSRRRRPRLA